MNMNLKLARVAAKMTQEDLADACGICRTTVHSVETEKTIPSGLTMKLMAKALGKKMDDLFASDYED